MPQRPNDEHLQTSFSLAIVSSLRSRRSWAHSVRRIEAGITRLAVLVILVVWLAALGLLAVNRQNITDWWTLRHYQAPQSIAELATQDTMTPLARRIFYVNKPDVMPKAA